MATYTYKRCPHCKKTYETYSTHTKHFSNHSGSPFLTCKHCGKTFVDKDIKEPALEPYSDSGYSLLNCVFAGFWPFGLTGIILTGYAIKYHSIGVAIAALIVGGVYFAIMGTAIKNRKKFKIEDKLEYERSYERLKDINYAVALKNAGFDVPSHFLEGVDKVDSKSNAGKEEKDIIINVPDNMQENAIATVGNNREKYSNYDIEFAEMVRDWYDSWKNKTPNQKHYDFLKYWETLDSCFKKDGKSTLEFCYELHKKGIAFDEDITDHIFNQLNNVLNCSNKNEIDLLKKKVVSGIDGFYVAWVLEHS